MNSEMTFNMEGPMMSGMWVNPKTGDSFTVKDSFFQDNQYMVQTTDGRLIGYDRLSQYIQTDSKGLEAIRAQAKSKDAAGNGSKQADAVPPEILSMVDQPTSRDDSYSPLPDDMDIIYGNKTIKTTTSPTIAVPNTTQSEEDIILARTLKKTASPEVRVDVCWNQYPGKKIDMLTELMDIDVDDIVDYYVRQIDVDSLKVAWTAAVRDYVYKKLNVEITAVGQEEECNKVVNNQEKMAKVRTAKKLKKESNDKEQ